MSRFAAFVLRRIATLAATVVLMVSWSTSLTSFGSATSGSDTASVLARPEVKAVLVDALATTLTAETGRSRAEVISAIEQLDDADLRLLTDPLLPSFLRGSTPDGPLPGNVDIPGLGPVSVQTTQQTGTLTPGVGVELQRSIDQVTDTMAALRARTALLLTLALASAAGALVVTRDRRMMLRRIGRGWLFAGGGAVVLSLVANQYLSTLPGLAGRVLAELLEGQRVPLVVYAVTFAGAGLVVASFLVPRAATTPSPESAGPPGV